MTIIGVQARLQKLQTIMELEVVQSLQQHKWSSSTTHSFKFLAEVVLKILQCICYSAHYGQNVTTFVTLERDGD